MRTIVANFAAAPVPAPMPVVMHKVVHVGTLGSRPCQRLKSRFAGTGTVRPRPMEARAFTYHVRAARTSPITPLRSFSTASIMPGHERRWFPIWTTRLCLRAAATMSSASGHCASPASPHRRVCPQRTRGSPPVHASGSARR
jgi:hypothetical protein